jgi:uroporphyrinogen III methyltransferase/synthase
LIDRGWPAATPAAIVADASLPRQQTWRGALAGIASGEATIGGDAPAVIIVGEVAAMNLTDALVESLHERVHNAHNA